jgi:hypothetical protein
MAALHAQQAAVQPLKPLPTFTLPNQPPMPSLTDAKLTHWNRTAQPNIAGRAQLAHQSQTGLTIPLWSGSDSEYDFVMVGQDPTVKHSDPVSVIPTLVIPVRFNFYPNVVSDPEKQNTCGPHPVTSMIMSSPVFTPVTLLVDQTPLGKGQFASLFQRANFWTYTKPDGINPGYQISLVPSILGEIKINVNQNGFYVNFNPCAPEGYIDIKVWDTFLQSTIFPALETFGVGPNILPILIFENIAIFEGDAGHCCILGYHNAFLNQHGVLHTYAVANYESNGFFGLPDILVLSREIADWMDDPTANNPTPPWGNIGNVTGCESILEVGGPLSGAIPSKMEIFSIPMYGFTYHVQDLAFKSWFYNDPSSSGVNGWYSLLGTFTSAAAPCAGP